MKIILYESNLNNITVYPDSAVGRDAMPLFLPDGGPWHGAISLAFRIGRLGKNVREKFALRYIDGISAALTLVSSEPWISIMDNAVTPGQFVPYDPENPIVLQIQNSPLKSDITSANPVTDITIDANDTMQRITQAISQITSVSTIKTGDIILIPLSIPTLPLATNTRLQITLNTHPILNLKIK